MDDFRDMDDAELVAVRHELTAALKKIVLLKSLVVWGNRMEREVRELAHVKGNNNALNLAAKGYKDEKEMIGSALDEV